LEDLQRIGEEWEERWTRELQQQAEAAVAARMPEEVTKSGPLLGEGSGRVASLAEGSLQLEKQTQAALAKLSEEVNNSARLLEEGRRQVHNLAATKLAALGQTAAGVVTGIEAEEGTLKSQYEAARKELENLAVRRLAKLPLASDRTSRSGTPAKLVLRVSLLLAIAVPPFCVYLSTPAPAQPRLQAAAPADFLDQNPNWNGERRSREEEVAQAYWRLAVVNLQARYRFGSELPVCIDLENG